MSELNFEMNDIITQCSAVIGVEFCEIAELALRKNPPPR